MTLTPFEQVVLIGTGVSSCLNTALQILRSYARRKESEERRRESEQRQIERQWLYEHGQREEAATQALMVKHQELADVLRSVTPASGTPKLKG